MRPIAALTALAMLVVLTPAAAAPLIPSVKSDKLATDFLRA
jgi:hypothetical protein